GGGGGAGRGGARGVSASPGLGFPANAQLLRDFGVRARFTTTAEDARSPRGHRCRRRQSR
ncbi:hypothetical protein, partial [Frankia sp. AgKG'84/4]|uniref:hypothetical protein n=1 Tax=Frankia sp. AgKG'84/4 TaxID=573490 RepID=UPI00202A43EB